MRVTVQHPPPHNTLNVTFWSGTLDPPPYVLKPTLSRESFWNYCIKKWSYKTCPFILNDNIIRLIAFLNVFGTKNGYQKTQKNIGLHNTSNARKYELMSKNWKMKRKGENINLIVVCWFMVTLARCRCALCCPGYHQLWKAKHSISQFWSWWWW